MQLYTSKMLTDEEGGTIDKARLAMVYGSKEEVLKICAFFAQVAEQLEKKDKCHLHLRDDFKHWDSSKHIDIEINVD